MIKVTKFNKEELVLNAELIESIDATPDTGITLLNGKRYVVRESVDQVIQKVIEFKRMIYPSIIKNFREENGDGGIPHWPTDGAINHV